MYPWFRYKTGNLTLPGKLPDGSPRYIWIDEMFLDDLQRPGTYERFPVTVANNPLIRIVVHRRSRANDIV